MGWCRFKLSIALLSSIAAPCMALPHYYVTDLGTLGGSYSFASGINEQGDVVGSSGVCCDTETHGFLWSKGRMTSLADATIWHSEALAINAAGQVTGFAYGNVEINGATRAQAYVYKGGTRTDIGTLGGHSSEGYAINASGAVTGWSLTSAGAQHAFVYDGATMSDIGTLGGERSGGAGINDLGQITGWALTSSGDQHAFLRDGTTMRDLGTLGGQASYGQAINNRGHVAGWSTLAPGSLAHASLYEGAGWNDLGTLGGEQSYALGLNGKDDVVGFSMDANQEQRAFVYTEGSMFNLNELSDAAAKGWTLAVATSINNSGAISGSGMLGGQLHAFLLTTSPIPEPSSWQFLCTGLLLVSLLRRPLRLRLAVRTGH
jgi:probable HAF family extracellular repeat protein